MHRYCHEGGNNAEEAGIRMPRGGSKTRRKSVRGTPEGRDVGEGKDSQKIIIKTVNEILNTSPIDVSRLRKISAVCGLSCNSMRARVWPILLGINLNEVDVDKYIEASKEKHKDTSTVQVSLQNDSEICSPWILA